MIKAKFYTYLSLYFTLVRNDKLEHLNIEDLKIKMFNYLAFLTVNVISFRREEGLGVDGYMLRHSREGGKKPSAYVGGYDITLSVNRKKNWKQVISMAMA